jgi:indole-3-glycerol phosphate synthase
MSILAEIIAHKRTEIAALDAGFLRRAAESSPAPGSFLSAIKRQDSLLPLALPHEHRDSLAPPARAGVVSGGQSPETKRGAEPGVRARVSLIAELKRASPSKGILAPHLDLFQVAEIYAENGAAAISVLTDEKFFLGKLETLHELRFARKSGLPLLRKDFLIDEVQLYESRANGADAVLLIAAALTDDQLFADLHALALDLGLAPLVEVHNEAEAERALKLKDIHLIGINNRDLATFHVSLETTERIRPIIPAQVTVIAESGIFTARDVERLAQANVDAILVGEALITADDIASKVRELRVERQMSKVMCHLSRVDV